MALTPQQKQLLQGKLKQEDSSQDTVGSYMTQQSKGNFFADLAKDIAKPFAQVGTTAVNVGESVYDLARGDVEGAGEALGKTRDVPLLGETTPAFTGQESTGEAFKKMTGFGAEIGSSFLGGGGAVKIGEGVLKKSILKPLMQGLKFGTISGTLFGAGRPLQEDKDIKEVLQSGFEGALYGAATGGVLGGAGGVFNFLRKAPEISRKLTEKVKPYASTARGFGEELVEDVKIKGRGLKQKLIEKAEVAKKDPLIKQAIRVDIPETTANIIKEATPADKTAFAKMFKMAEKAEANPKMGLRPVKVAGESILERVKHINTTRKTVGKQLGEAVDNMKGAKIKTDEVASSFLDELDKLGADINTDGKLSFVGTAIENDVKTTKLIQQLFDDLSLYGTTNELSAQKIHRLRQRIFNDLNMAKKTGDIGDVGDRLLTQVRKDMATSLEKISPEYKKINKQFAELSQIEQDFYGLIGKKWQGKGDDILGLRAAEVGNRILGNASAVPLEVLERMEKLAVANGFKPTNNVVDLLMFSDLLEDIFEISQKRSLRGQTARGTTDVLSKTGLISKGAELLKGDITKEQRKAIMSLLGI